MQKGNIAKMWTMAVEMPRFKSGSAASIARMCKGYKVKTFLQRNSTEGSKPVAGALS